MKKKITSLATVAVAAMVISSQRSYAQGSLTPPPGPVTPMMKSLAQIEPRTPINATTTPGSGTNTYVISQSGGYFLEGNLSITNGTGILITANDVTLDLRGLTISKASGSAMSGIVLGGVTNVSISHGSVVGFSTCIDAALGWHGVMRDVAVKGFTTGIYAGNDWYLSECRAFSTTNLVGTTYGIKAGSCVILDRCEASRLSGYDTFGFYVLDQATFYSCVACRNVATNSCRGFIAKSSSAFYSCSAGLNQGGSSVFGFVLWPSTLLKGCVANQNSAYPGGTPSGGFYTDESVTMIDCMASQNTGSYPGMPGRGGMGIYADGDGLLQNCTVYGNSGDGIHVAVGQVKINNCIATANGKSGIDVSGGFRSAIENNHVANNTTGIEVSTSATIITGNTATGNGTNYVIAASNRYGSIVNITAAGAAAASGNTAASTMTSTDPFANFAQ